MEEWQLLVAGSLAGFLFGSFGSVVIYRVPRGLSLNRPPSSCPSCNRKIPWYDNVPLVSFVLLRGRCRNCSSRISPRYPAIEAMTGLVWAGLFWRFGLTVELGAFVVFGLVLVILSAIDLERRRIPDKILLPASIAGLLLLATAAVAGGNLSRFGFSILGVLAFGLPMLVIGLIVPAGMGGGDIKLSAYLGLHLGFLSLNHVLVGALAGFALGGFTGLGLLLARRRGRKDVLPFGPFLAAGALIALLFGDPLLALWLGI